MAKEKSKKGAPNKHLYARIAFLQEISKYLTEQSLQKSHDRGGPKTSGATSKDARRPDSHTRDLEEPSIPVRTVLEASKRTPAPKPASAPGPNSSEPPFNHPPSGLSLLLSAQLRSIAQKGQIRLPRETKHSICKVCNSPLLEGSTCETFSENLSKGRRKPWVEVSVIRCLACSTVKRFPVGAKKQKRKAMRAQKGSAEGESEVERVAEGNEAREMPKGAGEVVMKNA